MKKIVFLDIDGVLNGDDFLCTGKGFIDRNRIVLLNKLQGTEIVISSSWGYDKGRTEKSLRECGLCLPIIGYTEHFHVDWMCRGNEIEKWLHDNFGGMCTKYGPQYHDERYDYVILDDDTDFLLGQRSHLVVTDRRIGLTHENIECAKKILSL